MMRPGCVSVVGAGPSGLAAAIELARNGVPVTVYEARARVGGRFHGDLQGIENWTTEEDALPWLERLGIGAVCPHRPTREVILVGPDLVPHTVRGDRPLLYIVERGPGSGSLDRGLLARAESLGVRFRFRRPVRPDELEGPVIAATGPRGTRAVVAGIVARTSHPDQVVAIARDDLAPKCYAYCVVWDGRATLASALARDFSSAWHRFERARAAFARLGLSDFRQERRFGGRADVSLGRTLEDDGCLTVGEAAGLQDYFLGFGLRYAMLSGHLAARSLLTGEPYPDLVARALGSRFRAGFVNRLLYDHLGDPGYLHFIRWVIRSEDVRARARRVYSLTPLHRALWPVARVLARRRGGGLVALPGAREGPSGSGTTRVAGPSSRDRGGTPDTPARGALPSNAYAVSRGTRGWRCRAAPRARADPPLRSDSRRERLETGRGDP